MPFKDMVATVIGGDILEAGGRKYEVVKAGVVIKVGEHAEEYCEVAYADLSVVRCPRVREE